MAAQIQVYNQLKEAVERLNKRQRIMLIGGTVLTLATLLVFAKFMSKPEYKPLFTDLEQQDSDRLASQLAAKKIPYEVSPDGKVLSVAADKVDAARIEIASEGMPHSGRLGFELFDKVSWGQTEFDEKVNYQRAMEGELERTIQTLNDVQSARVHLVLPTESVFISRERPAKASVIIKTKHGQLSDQSEMAISRLVAGAVDSLTPDNVTVTDADTNRPLKHKSTGWIADEDQERLLLSRLMTTLEPVLGPDNVRATVDVEYDPSTSEESQDSYDPNSQVAVSKQSSEEQTGSEDAAGGVPGTSSNIPGAKITAQPAGARDMHVAKTDAQTYAVNRISRHTVNPAGRIRRITAAIVVDDVAEWSGNGQTPKRRKWSPEELGKIEQLAQASLGIDSNRGDHVSIENISFERPPQPGATKPSPVEQVRTTLHNWSTAVRYGALLLLFLIVYLVMLRPVKREIITAFRAIAGGKTEAIEAADLATANLPEAEENSMFGDDAQSVKKQLIERVKRDPLATGRLIQAWVDEDAV